MGAARKLSREHLGYSGLLARGTSRKPITHVGYNSEELVRRGGERKKSSRSVANLRALDVPTSAAGASAREESSPIAEQWRAVFLRAWSSDARVRNTLRKAILTPRPYVLALTRLDAYFKVPGPVKASLASVDQAALAEGG